MSSVDVPPGRSARNQQSENRPASSDTKVRGDTAESLACRYLQARGLRLVARNYRVARGPHRRGGEIDLILLDERDGTLVFVEVRSRASSAHGGAAASISAGKRARVVFAAQHYLQHHCPEWPPCRFDVVAIDAGEIEWLPAAFDAGR